MEIRTQDGDEEGKETDINILLWKFYLVTDIHNVTDRNILLKQVKDRFSVHITTFCKNDAIQSIWQST
jgi:hypothetical protein